MEERSFFLDNLAAKVSQEVWQGKLASSIVDCPVEADHNLDNIEEYPGGQCESTRDELLRIVLVVVLTISSHPYFDLYSSFFLFEDKADTEILCTNPV